MKFELMRKDKQVAVMELSVKRDFTLVDSITRVIDLERMPIGSRRPISAKPAPHKLEDWINERCIPKERYGLKTLVDDLGLPRPNQLLLDSLGLSLSAQYWMRPFENGVLWKDVNFFQNEFSNKLGEALLGNSKDVKRRSFLSPDASSSGVLPKRWIISEGKRILMKGGKSPFFQEPINEVAASRVMAMLGIERVNYEMMVSRGKTYSLCETFVDVDTDFVSAYYIADMCSNMPSDMSRRYDVFLGWCEKRGIPGAREALDKIFIADFILFNTDRHFNNFGALRDANTLEWKGFSTVFDTGNCLWNDVDAKDIILQEIGECKPFRDNFQKQLLHVSDFSWVDLGALKAIPDEISGLLGDVGNLSPERVGKIRQWLEWRVKYLENVINNPAALREKTRRSKPRR
ncbi:MAG: hypothetical protein LBO66_00895 [Deltaproteobacteria bacterium]|jgi:hypothetical protein|nr:hypothetical protein [Deltaproteobacteria bacterium]